MVFRRLFVLDCNQERLIDILQNTFDSSLLAIGQKFDVHWPQVLLFSQSMTSSSSSLYQEIELYLSEYLGIVHVLMIDSSHLTLSIGREDMEANSAVKHCHRSHRLQVRHYQKNTEYLILTTILL